MAQKELKELQPLFLGGVDRVRKDEIQSWLERVKRLKHLFVERPDQRIPELDLLGDDDWLRIARWDFPDDDNGERKAMGDARNAAKRILMLMLPDALYAYAAAHHHAFPAQAADLGPYLPDPRAAPAMVRYEMRALPEGLYNEPSRRAGLQEVAPVDSDFDARITVNDTGGASMAFPPSAWIPGFDVMRAKAYRAYDQVHPGTFAPTAADVIPYFNPPLDSATQQKFLQSVQAAKDY